MGTIADNMQAVRQRIAAACERAGREPAGVRLLAVSKAFGPEAVAEAWACGQRAFGENYVQEGVEKALSLASRCPGIEWHFIGPLQSNKTRLVAEHYAWVHSVDRLKIAERLSQQRGSERPPLAVCIQVNVDDAPTKSGVTPSALPELALAVAKLPNLRLRGLMAVPDPSADPQAERAPFARLHALLVDLQDRGLAVDTLSMGMTADLEAAIAEGATFVRVGTAIFGRRT
jgi:pyridoxal phosphate enzyme (YggS family)